METIVLVVGLVALAAGVALWANSRKGRAPVLAPEEASRVVKQLAEKQKIEVRITPEQMTAILDQWQFDPRHPAQITFTVDDRPVGELKVATCAYWSDTCCA